MTIFYVIFGKEASGYLKVSLFMFIALPDKWSNFSQELSYLNNWDIFAEAEKLQFLSKINRSF